MAEAPDLRDFAVSPRLVFLSIVAALIGILGAFLALALLRLISLFTNIFFYGQLSTQAISPANNNLGVFVLIVPVVGGVIIGLMARFGSDRIRGHGIPEALEAILINGSRMDAKVAVLKPLSSAISIGSGGPFGAEGPIIMTGGAVGSLIAQHLHLTSAERKTLLVAGAAAGMSATFSTPVAATLLAVELLLFEWRPRSMVPVALASAAAAATRHYIIGPGPLFEVPVHGQVDAIWPLVFCAVAGLAAGCVSLILTNAVYTAEDAFHRFPVHWMWWPAIGGLAVGVGGFFFPEGLGVGYENIQRLLAGDTSWNLILGVLFVKTLMWSISLGSGTSGGVLAPLLMVGAALGALESKFFPEQGPGFWALISMAAILGGTMRTPLTAIVFAVELTFNVEILLPLLIAVTFAYGLTVVIMRRSILTEKVSRRGYHLSREYSVDPMELVFVREIMRPVEAGATTATHSANGGTSAVLTSNGAQPSVVAIPDEPLATAVLRMAAAGVSTLPVVDPQNPSFLVGELSLTEVQAARKNLAEADQARERVHTLRLAPRLPWRSGRRKT